MDEYIKSLILFIENSSSIVYGSSSFFLVWSICLIFFIFICVAEIFLKKFITKNFIDKRILKKIFSAIEVFLVGKEEKRKFLSTHFVILTTMDFFTRHTVGVCKVRNPIMAYQRYENSCNTIEAIQLLQKYPNYVNLQLGRLEYTPFLVACYHGNTLLVKYMLHINADVKSRTKRGETPFYLAVAHLINNPFSIDASCIRELFYAGCDVNEPNVNGYSPIHLAAFFGHKTLVRWLLEKGANTRIAPSPVEIAANQGHLEVASVISTWENRRRMIAPN